MMMIDDDDDDDYDDDDDKYILSITWNWMDQCDTYNPAYCEENKEGYTENRLYLRHNLDRI